jgi:hypothetical protein
MAKKKAAKPKHAIELVITIDSRFKLTPEQVAWYENAFLSFAGRLFEGDENVRGWDARRKGSEPT